MRWNAVFLAVGFVVLFSSCQKELTINDPVNNGNATTNGTGAQSLVKTYKEDVVSATFGNSNTTFTLTYDSLNRIKSIISIANGGDKFIYTYNSNNTYTMDQYTAGVLSIHETFFLNSNNLVDSTLQYNNTKDTTAEKYIYDTNKRLKQLKRYDVLNGSTLTETTYYTHDSNGNVLTEGNGSVTTVTYTYNTAQLNTLNIGQLYFAVNKHLIQTTTADFFGIPLTLTHSYTFDSNKRITGEKITSILPGETVTRTYTY